MTHFLETLLSDLRTAIRSSWSNPTFSVTLIATIGLGVGAGTAVFSVVDAVLIRPLPYHQPDRLVTIQHWLPEQDRSVGWRTSEALALRRETGEAVALTLYSRLPLTHTDTDEPVTVSGFAVTVNWLDTLGVSPALGRTFTPDEGLPGAGAVTILSHDFWRSRLAGDSDVVGSRINFDGRDLTVVGVMPAGFKFPALGPNEAWLPMASDGSTAAGPVSNVAVVAQIPDGQTASQLQERFQAIGTGLQERDPQPRGWQSRVTPFDNFRANRDVEAALWVLGGAVGLMLLIAAVNAANLLLVRGIARRDEIGVRLALGASRMRLVRGLLTETLLLVAAGGALAIAAAGFALEAILRLLPSEMSFFLTGDIAIDSRVMVFALTITAVTGLAVGLAPAWRTIARARGVSSSRTASEGGRVGRLRGVLVIAEVALSLTLLVGAGLMINSFLRLTAVEPGYNSERLAQLTLSLPTRTYPAEMDRGEFQRRLKQRALQINDVVSATIVFGDIAGGGSITFGITPQPEGGEPRSLGDQDFIPSLNVDPDFFQTLGIPILAGRGFTSEDSMDGRQVIIDRDFSKFLFGDQNPVGRRFRLNSERERWNTVVGLVGDVKLWGQDDRRARFDFFEPLGAPPRFMSLLVATRSDPQQVLPHLRSIVRDLDAELPIRELAVGTAVLSDENDKPRFYLTLMSIFAGLSLLLATVGTYGVLTFSVGQRRRELGIRVAVGARTQQILGLVLRQGLTLVALGVGVGLSVALALQRVIEGMLFGVEPTDPLTLVAVTGVLLAAAVVACLAPALRAARVNPVEVLRSE